MNELPRLMNVDRLSLVRGFALTQEPFFRSLLRASVKFWRQISRRIRKIFRKIFGSERFVEKQLAKEQIMIPPHLGRSMFGVMDETGQLQSGQIFVQYTNNVWLKTPSSKAAKTILKGPVLMTKNPCIVAGDVRIFEAVDIPELHHLVDVVVFPQYGPRPHTDEMAGSDLDGDEYTVIWDKKLMFVRNESPLDFTKRVKKYEVVDQDHVDFEMRKFFCNYIKQDSIGSIANAFLVNADLYGITSEVSEVTLLNELLIGRLVVLCLSIHFIIGEFMPVYMLGESHSLCIPQFGNGSYTVYLILFDVHRTFLYSFCAFTQICVNIARKHSQAVDFPKTGDAPEPLTKVWTEGASGSLVPPERSERWPDFMCKNHEPNYISPRLVGQLYRRIRLVDDVLTLTSALEDVTVLELDPMLIFPGWEGYTTIAQLQLDSYNAHIRALLDNYGIQDEGQLISGCISVIRNRISDRDVDDMSFYNTNHVIEKKVASVFRMFRNVFFEEFGGYERCTRVDKERSMGGNNDEDRRICLNPTEGMKQKASAYYITCYSKLQATTKYHFYCPSFIGLLHPTRLSKRVSVCPKFH
ncbi:unnamed protein product [Anisakis simplex]|uniref:RNA-dependent RNA polymerase n=1 Tax=Anisakis simplex TaxID=6269 RepID=A0A3P6PGG3_ANISI|nr:unnamed protein product [Anisakis simplex]